MSTPSVVWIVIRDYADGPVEVDVFTTEAAARAHAAWFDDAIIREETVATVPWAQDAYA